MSQVNAANSEIRPETDVHYQEVKLFIEGVQVPYVSIAITNSIGALPQAYISLPTQIGLPEITRFYNPKVHIFFKDSKDDVEKVLFTGMLLGSSYSKTSSGNGGSSITFQCVHRYQLMKECLVDYTKWDNITTNAQASGEVSMHGAVGAKNAIALALVGVCRNATLNGTSVEINQINVKADKNNETFLAQPFVLPANLKDYADRLVGMPGVLLNLWNQQKQFSYMEPDENEVTLKIFIPLIETGLRFFKRLTGHYYIENLIEQDRIDPCPASPSQDASSKPRIVSPSMRVFLRSAIQTDISMQLASSALQFTGELTDILTVFQKLLSSLDYEMQFLSSPAEAPLIPVMDNSGNLAIDAKTYATDVIVKPELPFYYSPVCNVIYPNMIHRLEVSQDDYGVPTRIVIRNDDTLSPTEGDHNTYYRAPASIREAIAGYKKGSRQQIFGTGASETTVTSVVGGDLSDTFGSSHNLIGLYEQGRGVKVEKNIMPRWLSIYSASQFRDKAGNEGWPDVGSNDYIYLQMLEKGWRARYGNAAFPLNPWSQASGVKAYQRLLVAAADYKYAMSMARSRVGTAELIFNPYIVPGYPIDLLDNTPNHPSYHAYCTSVTHNITSESIGTSISFVSAMTYTELTNYYVPPVHPWLQCALDFAEQQTIIDNETARQTADKFYTGALNVAAAAPTMLYDFNTGEILPVDRQDRGLVQGTTASNKAVNQGEINPNLTGQGNLKLVHRPIESRVQLEDREKVKFIDLTQSNYNPNVIKVANSKLEDAKAYLEPGQSQWLQYTPKFEDPNKVVDPNSP